MKYILYILLAICLCIAEGCHKEQKIHSGDIIFRGNYNDGISQAINEVTKTSTNKSYSHMGICMEENNTIQVYHATPKKGVCKVTLEEFCNPDDKFYYSDVYRLTSKEIPLKLIISRINKHIGEPYDSTYIIENPGLYCSEFIYEVLKPLHIFELHPMTFKNSDGTTNKIWLEYYNKLGFDIPEGKPGCNPNKMSQNKKLTFQFSIKSNKE